LGLTKVIELDEIHLRWTKLIWAGRNWFEMDAIDLS
jgi:hypothetical protein